VVFAARGADVPTYKPLLGADMMAAAAWVNAQSDWARLDVVGDFMRDRAWQASLDGASANLRVSEPRLFHQLP